MAALSRQFVLRIRDDGLGMDSQVLSSGGREGHFGLKGMYERAELAGGKLTVRGTRPGTGTELELAIPGRRAYIRGLFLQNYAQGPHSLGAVNQHTLDVAGCGGTGVKDSISRGRECGMLIRLLHARDDS